MSCQGKAHHPYQERQQKLLLGLADWLIVRKRARRV